MSHAIQSLKSFLQVEIQKYYQGESYAENLRALMECINILERQQGETLSQLSDYMKGDRTDGKTYQLLQ